MRIAPVAAERSARRAALLAILAVVPAVAFLVATDQVWEDAYIAYRHAAHLCSGAGLTYQAGVHIQGFSSPLATLLMAAAGRLVGCSADGAALLLFRGLGLVAFAGAAWCLAEALRRGGAEGWGWGGAAALLAVESKAVAFSGNGMETGFVLLALAASLRELARFDIEGRPWRLWSWWGALLWIRADGVVYVTLLALATLVVPRRDGPIDWRGRFGRLIRAGLVAAAVYLPWLAYATYVYGSPVPLTVLAKASAATGPAGALGRLPGILANLFLPAYAEYGGWDGWRPLSLALVGATALGALMPARETERALPALPALARRSGLAALGGVVYLALMPTTYPWYYPAVIVLALPPLARAVLLGATGGKGVRVAMLALLLLGVGGLCWLLIDYGRLAAATRRIVERDHRREIGLWLRQAATPGERVFLECPGYIGWFSGLPILDYPGLVSPQVVRLRRPGDDLPAVGLRVRAEWMVLRPTEVAGFERAAPGWLRSNYQVARLFDVSRELAAATPRHPATQYDAVFVVFARRDLPPR